MVNGVAIAQRRRALGLTQEELAERAGIALDTLCRLEQGRRSSARLDTLQKIAAALQVGTTDLLGDEAQRQPLDRVNASAVREAGVGDMERRDLLRVISAATAAIALAPVSRDDAPQKQLGSSDLAVLVSANKRLWAQFAAAPVKIALYPSVRRQLGRLTGALQRAQRVAVRRQLHSAAADAFQLAGEIFFDVGRYGDAAQCYTLATTAAREANAWDLWSCALTRHAYISIYEAQAAQAIPLLKLAIRLGHRGESALSTRHWAAAVLGQALAGTSDQVGCERALEAAEGVSGMPHPHNGGWLRFDAGRLSEDRAACYLKQQRPDLAEPLLTRLLDGGQPGRRRAITLVDLTTAGIQLRDPVRVVTHGFAALDHARNTGSTVVARRLEGLRPALTAMGADPHVRHLSQEIANLSSASL